MDWVSNKPAFLTLYIFQLSFSLLLPLFSFSPALYFLLTDDACLDQHSLRETYGGKDVFIEKLHRYRSDNLTVAMGNTKRRIYVKREFLQSVESSSSSYTLSPRLRTTRQIFDINFVLKDIFLIFFRRQFYNYIIIL